MLNKFTYLFLMLMFMSATAVFAQFPTNRPTYPTQQGGQQPNWGRDTTRRTSGKKLTDDQLLDTLRSREEKRKDSVIFTSKFIRVTNEALLNDSTQVFPLDTGLANFQNYSVLYQPRHPTIGLGNLGLSQRSLLFEPSRTIGFDVGQHAFDIYAMHPQDIQYYKARVPYTNLSLYTSGVKEQVFKLIHTQNINPNLNIGINFNLIGSRGIYPHQNGSDLNAAFFTWYQSKSKRYNLLANLIFNNLKAPENGSILNDSVFTAKQGSYYNKSNEPTRLINSANNVRDNGLYLKNTYYIGKIDSLKAKGGSTVLPTQRVGYTFYYQKQQYKFLQNEPDTYHVFPDYYFSSTRSKDSLAVFHLQNAFSYSFYLRGKSTGFVKNEVKLDLSLIQDYYNYKQSVLDTGINNNLGVFIQQDQKQSNSFNDITLRGRAGYRFSDRIGLDLDFQQVAQGRDFGNFLFDAKLTLSGGRKAGRIILNAYSQNSSPPLVYTDWVSNHFIWHNSFSNQKTTSASFNYINDALQLDIKAEYFLISDYLYFAAQPHGIDATPTQLTSPVNLLKFSLGKNLTWRRWHFDNYIVYQKTDYQSTLRVPEVYTYSSLYYNKLFFNVLNTSVGIDVRYNTPYVAPSYAVGLAQFYNNSPNVTFSSYPKAAVYMKATLYRTNLFIMYDYANQGLFSNGYYTVNRYPMPDHQLKFGVSWTFYN